MVEWNQQLSVHEFEQAPGDSEGQGRLACCSPWGRQESETTERPNNDKAKWSQAEIPFLLRYAIFLQSFPQLVLEVRNQQFLKLNNRLLHTVFVFIFCKPLNDLYCTIQVGFLKLLRCNLKIACNLVFVELKEAVWETKVETFFFHLQLLFLYLNPFK